VVAGGTSGVVPARGARPGGAGTASLLQFHNGEVLTSSVVQDIYWGTSWASAGYQGDKLSGLGTLYGDLTGSRYQGTNTEYYGTNGQVSSAVSYLGHVIDTSAGPRRAPKTSAVLAEVAKMITDPVANGYYPVYTDLKRGHAGYCAWHSWGTIGSVPVQFAFFFDLAGDSGCDPQSGYSGSQALKALANVSGHEISEAVTDPRGQGWYDSSGAENADKCAWTFSGSAVVLGGVSWKIQGNFSNAAAGSHTGYDGGGCIDGNQ
jgi:hypothetical protein